MTTLPAITVSIAFTTAPGDPNPAWEDVTQYVRAQQGISITRGRQDEFSEVQPSRLSLTLKNADGRFTPERPGSPYYPNVKKSKRIRVSARLPGNYVTNPSFETNVSGWSAVGAPYSGGGTIIRIAPPGPPHGSSAGQIAWPTSVGGSLVGTSVGGLVIGRTYTASAFVFLFDAGVRLTVAGISSGSFTSVLNSWVQISHTFAATATSHVIGIEAVGTTSGQGCRVDAVMVDEGSTVGTFTTTPPLTSHRFTGYVDEWPVAWADASATVSDVAITATSRQARLAKGRELRSIIECEYLQDNPKAYYPFGDAEGTIRAGNVSTTTQPPLSAAPVAPSGGAGIFFGQATGPGTDDLTAATFTPASSSSGFYMQGLFDQPIITGTDADGVTDGSAMIECFFSTTTAGGGLVSIDRTDLLSYMGLSISATGKLQGVNWAGDSAFYTLTSAATVTDGATHHAVLREQLVASALTATLFLDGVSVGSFTFAPWDIFRRDRLSAGATAGSGPAAPSTLFNGVLAHVAVYNTYVDDARVLAHAQAGLTGFSGERSDQRIARLARYAGVPASEVSTETGLSLSLTNQMTTGAQPIALMQDVVKTESGVLFDAGDGVLTFHARSHRYNSASALTLSAGGTELDGDLQPKLDDQGMANDITATRTGGVTLRAADTASIDDHGVYRDDLQLLTTDDAEVFDAAYWNLNTRSSPLVRVSTCSVNLHNASSAQKTAILARELGDKITLAGLPAQAPSTSMGCFIEGVSEQITPEVHRVEYNLSPAAQAGVWTLDSPTQSVLGSTTRLAY